MSAHTHVWTWPIAGYLFLGGLGAGMVVVAAIADLAFGLGYLFIPCALGSLIALGLGSFLLIFELGRPLQFWRVFSRQRAILTFGAWMVIALVIFDIVYFSFWFGFIPWSGAAGLRAVIAIVCLLLGCGVLLYTGIELSSMKARVFWNTPALPLLFVLSGLLVGTAADFITLSFWPYASGAAIGDLALFGFQLAFSLAEASLIVLMSALAALTLIGVMVYVLMMYSSSTAGARKAAKRWLTGAYAWAFWGGLVGVGLVLPFVFLLAAGTVLGAAAAVFILLGGVFLRFLVVYSDDRRELEGEALYWKRMPEGHEAFLDCDW